MRFKPEDIKRLEDEMTDRLEFLRAPREYVNTTRRAWDIFHSAKCYWVYDGDHDYNDSHIVTAFRKIFAIDG